MVVAHYYRTNIPATMGTLLILDQPMKDNLRTTVTVRQYMTLMIIQQLQGMEELKPGLMTSSGLQQGAGSLPNQ